MARRQPAKLETKRPPPSDDEEDADMPSSFDEEEDGSGSGSPMVSDDEEAAMEQEADDDDDEQDATDDDDADEDEDDDDDDDGPKRPNTKQQPPPRAADLTLAAKKQKLQQRAPIYDADAMHDRLEDIAWAESEGATFAETLALTSSQPSCPEDLDVDDDLQRELCFYNQALEAAKEAVRRFEEAGVGWHRPADYYAEMVKSDEHMGKVKDRLLYEQQTIEQAEERRKAREQKAFAKQTAAAKQRERAAEKKRAIESVSALRKQRARSGFAGELDDEAAVNGASAFQVDKKEDPRRGGPGGRQQALGFKPGERIRRGDGPQKGKKRLARDAKYGFGGRKRLGKQNDARSAADMGDYKPGKFSDQFSSRRGGGVKKGGGRFAGGGGGGARPGKARRQQQRGGGGGGGKGRR
jgi:rRNA-processing protein EBP2